MILLVLFVVGAVILGAGAMLSPAIPTAQPRVALAGTLALALIVGGTLFYASLFGWDTLVIDYLLFALVVMIFLGGTLSVGQSRAEKKGYVLEDADQGWTGPQDLAFFALVGFIFSIPSIILLIPFGTVAQGYGYVALTTQIGNSLNSFTPFQPDMQYVYANGFTALTAYLAGQLNQGIHTTQFGVAAVLGLLNVWLAYDFGSEIRSKGMGRAMGLAMVVGLSLFGLMIEGQFVWLMGIAFIQAFLIFMWRYQKYQYPVDAFFAGLMMGATLVAHHQSFIVLMLGYIPYLATVWLSDTRPSGRTWLVMALIIPLIALVATAPWLIKTLPILSQGLEAGIGSPFVRSTDNMLVMLAYHGWWLAPMALYGAWLGWQGRNALAMLCMVWVFLLLDFSSTGGIAAIFPFLDRYINPRDLAWGGVVIPYTILGGHAMMWLWDAYGRNRIKMTYRTAYIINGGVAVIFVALMLLRDPLQNVIQSVIRVSDQYASYDDIQALIWIKENAPAETVILNFPVSPETDWTATIAERQAIYFPMLPYTFGDETTFATQKALEAFWRNPADEANADLLREYGITHVFVPEIIVNRDSFDSMWRWDTPIGWTFEMQSPVADAPYLERVYGEDDSAQVYMLRDA
ncbi:MAG: hypothetical protein KJ043_07065 [Anaerolineae bacterium]|nr:hypothetical protein [Anaerolineae bacterium]